MPDIIKVAIVIPVYNRRETTLQGLRSLSGIDQTGLDVRIYIVDDASKDGTAEAVRREFPEVALVEGDGTLHYAAGTNMGIEAAMKWDPDFIGTMNDDSVFHDQFLQRMVKTARENPRSVVGALLLLWDEPHKVFQVGQVWRTLYGGWHIPQTLTAFDVPGRPFEVECVVGNCVLIPAAAIRECGMMDAEKFKYGWGDCQYFSRLARAGWKMVIEPKAYVWCEPNTNPAPLATLTLKDKIRVLFVNERHPLNLKRQFVARWHSAPTKLQAVAGFGVYLAGLGIKTLKLGDPWKNAGDPKQDWRATRAR
jgi:GT2 family glycosyltransferase